MGMGVLIPVFNSLVQNSVEPRHMSSAVANLSFVRAIGGTVGVVIFGSIVNNHYDPTKDGTDVLMSALQLMFSYGAIPVAIGFVLSFFVGPPLYSKEQLAAQQAQAKAELAAQNGQTTNTNSQSPQAEVIPEQTIMVEM